MLEQAIAENTAAIRDLIATINKGGIVNPVAIPVSTQIVDPGHSHSVSQSAPAAQAQTVQTSAAPATIDDVKAVALDAVKAGRQASVAAALAKFNAEKLGNLKPTDYAAFIATLRSN